MQTENDLPTALIIEDDGRFRETLAMVVRSEGYRAVCARDGREGIDILENMKAPSVIFLDAMMPFVDGHSVLDEIAGHPELRKVPILLMSAARSKNYFPQGINVTFLEKPIRLETILDELAKIGVDVTPANQAAQTHLS